MKEYHLYQVDSFTKTKLAGNPAGVITNAGGLADQDMQRIARELNNSETAFILPPCDGSHDVHIRFFTPTHEVPICGHATIAAHYARAVENNLGNVCVRQKTGVGILPVDVVRQGNDYKMIMTQGAIAFGEQLAGEPFDEMLAALHLTRQDILENAPVQVVSTGYSKVMVPLRSMEQLHQLAPDMQKLAAVSQKINCNGFYTFALNDAANIAKGGAMVHGRMFAPAAGINEDPVTGNANGPLGAYLVQYRLAPLSGSQLCFTVIQGEAMGRAGTMEVTVAIESGKPVEVKIAGYAVIAFQAKLLLE